METIRNYLEAMFANMTNTPEVKKAKAELLQMMEDKYNELIADGVSENEAVGTVISEFGNLDELAQELGLEKEVEEVREREQTDKRRFVSLEEVQEYLECKVTAAKRVALGVFLCIVSVIPPMICEFFYRSKADFGPALMFVFIAVAVGLFISTSFLTKEWDYLKKGKCKIDIQTANYVKGQQQSFKKTSTLCHTIGVALCILSVVPSMIAEIIVGPSLLFVFVGVGVFLIVYASIIGGSYEEVLKINDAKTISGEYGYEGTKRVKNRKLNKALWLVLIILLIVWACEHLLWIFPFSAGKTISDSKSFGDVELSNVEIDLAVADLTIEYGHELAVDYEFPSKLEPTVTYENGKLIIKQSSKSNVNPLKGCKMNVTIPANTELDNFNVLVDLGDLNIVDVNAVNMTVEASCGDVDMSQIDSDNAKFILNVGDLDVNDSEFEKVFISCDVGDVDMEAEFAALDAECNVGDLDVITNSNINTADVKIECDLGEATVNGKKW